MAIESFFDHHCSIYHNQQESTSPGYGQQPQNDMDSDIKLTLPAGTDVRLNDKIVSSETGLEYTAGQPRNIRGHHMTVKIYRTAQQRPL